MAFGCQLLALLAIAFGDSAHAVRSTAAVEEVAPTLGWECYCSLVSSEKECPDTGAAASAPAQPDLHRFFNPDDKSCCFLQYDKRKPSTPPGPEYTKQLSLAKCKTDTRSFPKRRCCRVLAGYDESSPVVGFYVGNATAFTSIKNGAVRKVKPTVTKDFVLGGADEEGHVVSWQEVFKFLGDLKKKDMLPSLECLSESIEEMMADQRPCNLYR